MAAPNSSRMSAIPEIFARSCGQGRKLLTLRRGEFIFRQGDPADGIYFVAKGRVRLSATSVDGKEATFALLGPHELFGEQCLLCGQQTRIVSASAAAACEIVRVDIKKVTALLERDTRFATFFLRHVVSRMAHYEQSLVHHVINNVERRLARTLLQLSSYDSEIAKPKLIEDVSQELLAEIVGSSRPRISGFMNKFRRLGFIEYGGNRIVVKPSLVSVLFQHNQPPRARRTQRSA